MAAAYKEGRLYVLSRGRLCILQTSPGAVPAPIGEIEGLGNTRQIQVSGNLAAVTSRDDGFWLIDVADPAKPAILSHYDSIELATGVALGQNIALVACRQYGVEQIDISDPRRPRHMSTFRTGEAQSVFLQNGLAYVGDWAPRKVIVCDLRDPWRPARVSEIPMDGFGDGVFVRDNICFAATGHHSGAKRKSNPGETGHFVPDDQDEGYGRGHGLEIFDVSDPAHAQLLSRTKLPRFYHLSYDMWNVQVSGHLAVVGDTHNGIYVFDIRDLSRPVPVGYHRLPVAGKAGLPDAVGGFTLGKDFIYVAGVQTGLHTVPCPGIQPVQLAPQPMDFAKDSPPQEIAAPATAAYRPDGQVHEVAADEATGEIWVAAGRAGLHRFSLNGQAGRQLAETQGIAFSVDFRDGMIAVGEGTAGLSLWNRTPEGIALAGRYASKVGGIGQVRISPDKRYLIAHAGPNVLEVLDIASPKEPRRVLDECRVGLFYRTPFSHGFLPDGRFGCCWHVTGMYIFDLKDRPEFSGWMVPGSMDLGDGMAVSGDRFVATRNGGYVVLQPGQTEVTDRDIVRVPNCELRGKPSVFGTTLYTAQRWKGTITAVDMADSAHPALRWSLRIAGNPGPVQELSGKAIIPGGYDGVIVMPNR
jgi:hypothetical protein